MDKKAKIMDVALLDEEDGAVLFKFHGLEDNSSIRAAILDLLSEYDFDYGRHYTLNSRALDDEFKRNVAVFFRDPEYFIMFKLAYQ